MKAGSAPLWLLCIATSSTSFAQSNEEMNAANNPLQPALGLNLQNYYIDSYYGAGDADSNSALLRAAVPHKLFGRPQLLRATLPIVTSPDLPPLEQKTDVGDLNLFDILLTKRGQFELGLGPQLTAPTAGRDETGTGKWQAGLAALVVSPRQWDSWADSSPGNTRSSATATSSSSRSGRSRTMATACPNFRYTPG
ncbi:hypothetical protein ACFPN2_31310 [Steroidobacter flavus]|uniref:Uncharacterized protein n=1 Tax=Steroidobacter flavus TaxID=1842136 RepID=A0ABV8T4G9_9GAMM